MEVHKMEHKLTEFKTAMAVFFTAIGAFLGWQGIMAVVWVGMMALDYISGTLAACRAGEWSSQVARDGLWHKGGMIFVVVVAAVADGIMAVICANLPLPFGWTGEWPGLILPLVLAWYIITELGSILENAAKMGAPMPEWLVKLLKATLSIVNKAGENAEPKPPDSEDVYVD